MEAATAAPYRLERSDQLGRHLTSAATAPAGSLLLRERPLAAGPAAGALRCYRCHAPLDARFSLCAACRRAPVCWDHACLGDKTAGGAGEGWHSAAECRALAAGALSPAQLVSEPGLLLPLRCLLLRRSAPAAWARLLGLQAHLAERRGSPVWACGERLVPGLVSLGVVTAEEGELVQRVCGILDVNSYEVRGATGAGGVRALYHTAALLTHDCVGNTHLAVGADCELTARAASDLRAGELLTYNYVDPLQCTADRRQALLAGKYFWCACRRCADPAELGAHLGSVACGACAGAALPAGGAWRCACGHSVPGAVVAAAARRWQDQIDEAGEDERLLEAACAGADTELSPQHAVALAGAARLAGARRARLARETRPALALLRAHLALLGRLLRALRVVTPPVCRAAAIALHEAHGTRVQLARRLHDARETDCKQFAHELDTAEEECRAALRTLVLEPLRSPEGALCAAALRDLRALRALRADHDARHAPAP